MTFTSRAFRAAMGRFATGVTVVTCRHEGRALGITVNSFTSVSLDPPLVLWCLAKEIPRYRPFREADHYAVNILEARDRYLSDRFARPDMAYLDDLETEAMETGAPILKQAVTALDCSVETITDGGDHSIMIGRVRQLRNGDPGTPLLFYAGTYYSLGGAEGAVGETEGKPPGAPSEG